MNEYSPLNQQAQEIQPTIFGGQDTDNPAFTEHAYKILENGEAVCTGFEFPYHAENMVIATAAHCVEPGNSYQVLGPGKGIDDGEVIPAMPVLLKQVDSAQPLPEIALLITLKKANNDLPYKIAQKNVQKGDDVTIVGFGRESVFSTSMSPFLKEAHQTVKAIGPINDGTCDFVELKEFCAVPGDGNGCKGDSGGQIFKNEKDGSLELVGMIVTSTPNDDTCTVANIAEEWRGWDSQAFLCATNPWGNSDYCEVPQDCILQETNAQEQTEVVRPANLTQYLFLPAIDSGKESICVNVFSATQTPEPLSSINQDISSFFALVFISSALGQVVKNRIKRKN